MKIDENQSRMMSRLSVQMLMPVLKIKFFYHSGSFIICFVTKIYIKNDKRMQEKLNKCCTTQNCARFDTDDTNILESLADDANI